MNRPTRQDSAAETRARRFWVGLVVLLLAGPVVFHVAVIAVAAGDPSFAVEPDYHEKALAWDEEMEQRRRNEELGWRARATLSAEPRAARLTVTLVDSAGAPVDGAEAQATAFHLARSNRRHRVSLQRLGPGLFTALLPADRVGLWEVRVRATKGETTFTTVARVELREGDG